MQQTLYIRLRVLPRSKRYAKWEEGETSFKMVAASVLAMQHIFLHCYKHQYVMSCQKPDKQVFF